MQLARIKKLSPLVISQIAAGEVVERPSSVVKELLENAIDAGATDISVRIEQAGTRLIDVSDNGKGIHPDDLAIALSRHATSKLTSDDVLSGVSTLGFRGEALASIAAVARLTLASSHDGSGVGRQLSLDGIAADDVSDTVKPVAMAQGTQVLVKDLFFNLPARRRFLKSHAVEFGHIENIIKRLALVYFDIAFTLYHQGQLRFSVKPASTQPEKLARISQLMGGTFHEHALPILTDHEILKLSGWIVPHAMSDVVKQPLKLCFVNGRLVQNRGLHTLLKVIGADHEAMLEYVVFLNVPDDAVDANIHPTKLDVRLHDEQGVHAILRHVVSKQLNRQDIERLHEQSISAAQTTYFGEPLHYHDRQLLLKDDTGFYYVDLSGLSDVDTLASAHDAVLRGKAQKAPKKHMTYDEVIDLIRQQTKV